MYDSLVKFSIQMIKQGTLFIAYSHTLDISTTGKSEKQANDNFNDLLNILLKDLIKRRNIDAVLLENGWTQRAKRWSPPMPGKKVTTK